MQKKIYSLFILMSVLLSFNGYAQKIKVIEESQRKKPEWVNGLVKEYVIVMAAGSNQEEAQQKALAKIKEQIINAVAQNVQTTTEYSRGEQTTNNISDFFENIETNTKTQSADVNFLKGISMSQVEAFYWEKIKKGDQVYFEYHLKYPFSTIKLQKLVKEFERADKARTDALNELIAKVETEPSVEKMSQLIKELETTEQGFKDYDSRKNKAKVAASGAKQTLRNISIETVSASLGEIKVLLKAGERVFTTSRRPKVKSNCAKITDVTNQKEIWTITYSYDECYDDPDNVVNIEFRNSYGSSKAPFYFNINADKVDVFVNEDIHLVAPNTNSEKLSGVECKIAFTSKYDSPFKIEQVVLKFGKEAPVIIENINQQFENKGKHSLTLVINQELNKEIYSSKNYPMIKGTISFTSVKTGEKFTYKMFNQNITTNW